jgi:hypothetical protein
LVKVERAITTAHLQHWDPQQPGSITDFMLSTNANRSTLVTAGVLGVGDFGHSSAKVLTPYHELVARLIAKGCLCYCALLGHEPSNIVVPFSKDRQHWLWQFSDLWQSALANFPGQIREHLLHSELLQFASLHAFVFPKIILSSPLSEAATIFTDASGRGTAAAYYTKDCHKVEHTVYASAQRAELYAVIMVLRDFSQQPINLYSDSHYVVAILQHIEADYICHSSSSEELFNLFFQLCSLVQT